MANLHSNNCFIHANLCRIVDIYSTANSINSHMKLPQKCDIFYISDKQRNMDNLNSRNIKFHACTICVGKLTFQI